MPSPKTCLGETSNFASASLIGILISSSTTWQVNLDPPAPDMTPQRPRKKARPAPGPAAAPSDSPIGLATTPSDSPAAARPASGLAVFADASGRGQMAFDVVTWYPVEREEAFPMLIDM